MNSQLAPIVLFVYDRPWHTQQTLEALSKNELASESILYIFADGPKENPTKEVLQEIKATREIIRSRRWCGEVIIYEKDRNAGLANSIIAGVTEIVNKHGYVIVLEDDLLLSEYFLLFMKDSLVRYENNPRVGQIGACNSFACGNKFPSSFFIPIPDCLGWATWKNRWQCFNPDANELLAKLNEQDLVYKFNVYGSYDMEGMLKMQIKGQVNSWAIRWQAVCIINDWLTLYPNPSLTNHIASKNATHANVNITPPLLKIRPTFRTVPVKETSKVIAAMQKGYCGIGDYYGNTIGKRKNLACRYFLKAFKILRKMGRILHAKKNP